MPVAVAARAVEHRKARGLQQCGGRLRRRAALQLRRVDVRHDADVGVHHVAVAVRRHGVDPRHAELRERLAHLRDIAVAIEAEPDVHRAQVRGVRILQRVGMASGPAEARLRHFDDGPEARLPDGVFARLDRALRVGHFVGHALRRHRHGLAVDDIAVRIAGHEREFEQREAQAGRDRVRPCDVVVKADLDHRAVADRGAHDVELARDRQVHLPEAVDAAPRKMRVAEQHAAAVRRDLRAERPAVRAEQRFTQVEWRQCGRGLCRRRGDRVRLAFGRRARADDRVGEQPDAELDHRQLLQAQVFRFGHRPHPGLAVALRRQLRRVIAQVAVVALHVAAGHGARVGARVAVGRRKQRVVHVAADEHVDQPVLQHAQAEQRLLIGAEVPRPLAADRDQLVRGLADIVLRMRPGDAVGQ